VREADDKDVFDVALRTSRELPGGDVMQALVAALVTRACVKLLAVGDVLRDMPPFLKPSAQVPAPLEAGLATTLRADGSDNCWLGLVAASSIVITRFLR
jgi:hypothetical protein